MTARTCKGMVVMALFLAAASPSWAQQYFVYSPKKVDSGQSVDKKDGILVQELQVQKGDTLYDISRKFSGHGPYYPQIILFNELKDPNRIYPGSTLKVPVTKHASAQLSAPAERPAKAASSVHAPKSAPRKAPQKRSKSSVAAGTGVTDIELSTRDLRQQQYTSKSKKHSSKKKSAVKKSDQAVRQKTISAPVPRRSVPEYVPPRALQPRPVQQPASDGSQKLFEQAVKAYRQDNFRAALELFDRFLTEYPSSALAPDASFYKAECYLKQAGQQ